MTDFEDTNPLPLHLRAGLASCELLVPTGKQTFDQAESDYFGAIATDSLGQPVALYGKKIMVSVHPVFTRGELDSMLLNLFIAAAKHSKRYRNLRNLEGLDYDRFANSYCYQDTVIFTSAHAVHVGRLVWTGVNYYGAVILNPVLVGVLHDAGAAKRIQKQMDKLKREKEAPC